MSEPYDASRSVTKGIPAERPRVRGGQPHHRTRVYPIQVAAPLSDASSMAARFPLPPVLANSSQLQTVLATERDLHARQRELVRASLFRCPDKGGAKQMRAH